MKRASNHNNSPRHIPYASEKTKTKKIEKYQTHILKFKKLSIYHTKKIRKTNDKIFRNKGG